MLNEFLEAEAYLGDPDADDIRLNYKTLTDGFRGKYKLDGISDVLTLIACHYIYDFCKVTEVNRETADRTALILRIWCGFEGDVSQADLKKAKKENKHWFKAYPNAEGWLHSYHKKYLEEKGGDWSAYSKEWSDKFHSNNVYRAKMMSYENIVAQAAARGPLKNYYLVISKNILEKEVRNSKGKKPASGRQKTILKILGAYKVLQLLHPGQESVLMQTARILNWLGYEANKPRRIIGDLTWNDKYIFSLDDYGDFLKLSVNQDFLSAIDISLQEDTSNISLNSYDIYKDAGHGKKNGLEKLNDTKPDKI